MLGQIHAAGDAEFSAGMVKRVDHVEGCINTVALTSRAAVHLSGRLSDIFQDKGKQSLIVLLAIH